MTDTDLILKACRGDGAAAAALFSRHRAAALRYASRYSGNVDKAEDIIQEASFRCLQRLHRFNPDGAATFRTWYYAFISNVCREHHREATREILFTELEPAVVAAIEPSSQPMDPTFRTDLLRGLQELPSNQREAFRLYYFEGQSMAEVAGTLDVPEGTVKAWLFRARRLLANSLMENGNANGSYTQ